MKVSASAKRTKLVGCLSCMPIQKTNVLWCTTGWLPNRKIVPAQFVTPQPLPGAQTADSHTSHRCSSTCSLWEPKWPFASRLERTSVIGRRSGINLRQDGAIGVLADRETNIVGPRGQAIVGFHLTRKFPAHGRERKSAGFVWGCFGLALCIRLGATTALRAFC